jgi:uncharacterized protein (TIGR00290 family)
VKAWLAWSSGKDSAWSLHVLRVEGEVEVAGLLTTVNASRGRVAMHDVRRDLLQAQAEAVGLPLHVAPLPDPCPNDAYEAAMREALDEARRAGIEAVAFGDLFLEEIRHYRESQMAGTGLRPLFPLWGRPTAALAREMVAGGLRARVTCVDPRRLDASFAGREFDARFLDDLPPGVDPCGENGEFHTFAWDGPGFKHPVRVRSGAVAERGGFVYADLVPDAAGASVPASLRPLAEGRAT